MTVEQYLPSEREQIERDAIARFRQREERRVRSHLEFGKRQYNPEKYRGMEIMAELMGYDQWRGCEMTTKWTPERIRRLVNDEYLQHRLRHSEPIADDMLDAMLAAADTIESQRDDLKAARRVVEAARISRSTRDAIDGGYTSADNVLYEIDSAIEAYDAARAREEDSDE